MIRLIQRLHPLAPDAVPGATLTLNFEDRLKSRARVRLDDGQEAGLFLERGGPLRAGDLLGSDTGLVVRVQAAPELLSRVNCPSPRQLARACYHLGNRHAPVEIGEGWLRYRQDSVLDDLARHLGLTPTLEQAPFEPEAGAYQGAHEHPY